jgi:hypothetical protein
LKKENPPPQLHENPQQGADGKPQTETKVKFYKEDKNTLNCALLFNIVLTLCILLYRIGFGGNKLFVFVFVFVKRKCRYPRQKFGKQNILLIR